ncbi:MAG: DNA repair protein RecN [Oscillospiraceae bacterium]|nr:DNA repair protein RecN [Oscillospiraceae bacterium]
MLTSLKIENVAVIEQAEILFDGGLNILTGETGAGKSIVIDAINAVLGERTSKELIRDGADRAKVTAFFEKISPQASAILDEYEIESEPDGSLLVTRVITSDGRSSCKINGHPVTVSMLKSIGRELITICGQHDSQYLLMKDRHLSFIDAIADSDELLSSYRETYSEIKKVRRELKKITGDDADKERRLEFLKYQIDELKSANIVVGEKNGLMEEKKKFQNREKILGNLTDCDRILNGDGSGITGKLYDLSDCLEELSRYDSGFREYAESIAELKYALDECSARVRDSLEGFTESDFSIDAVEERLDQLYRLSKKYGATEEEMLAYLDDITEEYESISMSGEIAEKLQEQYDELADELFRRGCYLSDSRKQAAITFEKKVEENLRFLDMPEAAFVVDFREAAATETGIDDVEFLFSANPGQEPKPLAKIASGGELSRVMLAIRCVLSDQDSVGTMIFDEIDTGVSGRAAHKIAYKLRELSVKKQVLCVTHLAQIAAYADNHLYIEKSSDGDKTYTAVTALDYDGRIREIARIIGGDVLTNTTLDSAREMIEFASKEQNSV